MLTKPLIHFAIGVSGALLLLLLFTKLSGEQRFSFPSAVIIVGISCATLAHFLSPWATPVILILYAVASINELQQVSAARKAMRHEASRK